MSLGPVTGTSVVGRPLELVAPIQFDEQAQGNGSGCVTAQVRYGDKLIDRAQVDVKLGADAAHQLSYARISSPVLVDEPFVTVVLNAGCGRSYTRRYVLLAEAPTQAPMQLAAAPVLLPAAKPATVAAAAAATAQVQAVPAVAARSPRVASARSERAVLSARSERAVLSARSERAVPTKRLAAAPREAVPRSRGALQLAVWDPNSERLPWLRTSTELKSSPTTDLARRAAALSLWRALNAQPQDLLRTADRLRGLEGEVNSLRGLSARHRAEIASARESLQSAQARRHTGLLLVTLAALVAGSAAAVLWHRARRREPTVADSWYGPLEPVADAAVVQAPPAQPAPMVEPGLAFVPVAEPRAAPNPPPPEAAKEAAAVDRVPSQQRHGAAESAPLPFLLSDAAPLAAPVAQLPDRPALKVDALQGAQQQAEFFASLGQVDEAVAVLTSYLEESSERPVLVYLELFHIYHGTGMRVEYEELQSTFRQTFGMDVASFGEYKDEPRELDMFLLPVTRIASAWPSERSLEIIEELLFKRPPTPRDLLSLEAYRELLWLYGLGQEVVHNTGSPAGLQLLGDRGMPNNHFILPWAVSGQDEPTELSLDRLDAIDVARGNTSFGVDIDLTAMRGDGPQPADVPTLPPQAPATEPAVPALPDVEAFDAVMEAQSRRHSL
ncbi:hypothetical protein ACFPOE_00290 [Caenimonas terrae]|uniref:Tetratricopeptide repeat protein n=1 Tax=Caenimonas terrae TaxID=696074 RepID=A0ABW0N5Q0_9BURK